MRGLLKTLGALFAASVLTATGWAQEAVNPKPVYLLDAGKIATDGWTNINKNNNYSAFLQADTTYGNGGPYATTTSGGNFFNTYSAPSGVFSAGTYEGLDGRTYSSVLEEMAATLGLESIPESVYSDNLVNGGTSNHILTVHGLNPEKCYVMYYIGGANKDNQAVAGFTLEQSGYLGNPVLDYVCTSGNASYATSTVTAYANVLPVTTALRAASNGYLLVRVSYVKPTAEGFLKFKLSGERANICALAIAEIDPQKDVSATVAESVNFSDVEWSPSNAKPNANVTLNVSGEATLTMNKNFMVNALTVQGAAPLTIAKTDSNKLTATTTTINADTTVNAGAASLGTVTIAADKTLTVKDNATVDSVVGGTLAIDATAGDIAFTTGTALTLDEIRQYTGKIHVKGAGENGITLAYAGAQDSEFGPNLILEGGTHTFYYQRANGRLFASGDSNDNPTIWVTKNAKLTFRSHDLSGWQGDVDATGVIRVNNGSTLNFTNNDTSTSYYRQRLYLEPGAKMTIEDAFNQNFRLQGGIATADTAQLYVPGVDANAKEKVATISGGKITFARDATKGLGVNVGTNATLEIASVITWVSDAYGTGRDAPIAKYGEGTLLLKGGYEPTGNITINAGTLALGFTGALTNVITNNGTIAADGENVVVNLTGATLSGSGTYAVKNKATLLVTLAQTVGKTIAVETGATLKVKLSALEVLSAQSVMVEGAGTVQFVDAGGNVLDEGRTYTPDIPEYTYTVGANEPWGGETPVANAKITINFGETENQVVDLTTVLGEITSVAQLIVTGTNGGTITNVANVATCTAIDLETATKMPAELVARADAIASTATLSIVGTAEETTVAGVISGNGQVKIAAGKVKFTAANTYTGGTEIAEGATIEVATIGKLPTSGAIVVDGRLRVNSGNSGTDDSAQVWGTAESPRLTGSGVLEFVGTTHYVLPDGFTTPLAIENNHTGGIVVSNMNGMTIGTLSGEGKFRSDWGTDITTSEPRVITVKQSAASTFSGTISPHRTSGSRRIKFLVTKAEGVAEEVDTTLTLAGNAAPNNGAILAVAEGAMVKVTGEGSWAQSVVGTGTIIFEGKLLTGSGYTDAENWTGTLALVSTPAQADIAFNRFGNASSTVRLQNYTGSLSNKTTQSPITCYNPKLEIKGTNTISTATQYAIPHFKGAVSGDGSITFSATTNTNYLFSGDFSGFTGTMSVTERDGENAPKILFGDAGWTNWDSGWDSIATGSQGKIVIATAVELNGTLNAVNGVEVLSAGTLSGTGKIDSALTYSSTAESTFGGSITGNLTVASGTLELTAFQYDKNARRTIGNLAVNGGTLRINAPSDLSDEQRFVEDRKSIAVAANAILELKAGYAYLSATGDGSTKVTGNFVLGVTSDNGLNNVTTHLEVVEGATLSLRNWRADDYALTPASLKLNGRMGLNQNGSSRNTYVVNTRAISGKGSLASGVTLALQENATIDVTNGVVTAGTVTLAGAVTVTGSVTDGDYILKCTNATVVDAAKIRVEGFAVIADATGYKAVAGGAVMDANLEATFPENGQALAWSALVGENAEKLYQRGTLTITFTAEGQTFTFDKDAALVFSQITINGNYAGTLAKTGSATVSATATAINTDTTVEASVASLGTVTIANDKTLTVKDVNAVEAFATESQGTLAIDATAGNIAFTAGTALTLDEIRQYSGKIKILGTKENGTTLAFPYDSGTLQSQIEYVSGTHALNYGRSFGNGDNPFATGKGDASPTILVKNGATVNFAMKDLSGWNGAVSDTPAVIRVENGGILNFKSSEGTGFFRDRLVLDGGAVVENVDNNFILYGGASEEATKAQIAMLDSDTPVAASFNGTVYLRNTNNDQQAGTIGASIAVGNNATLTMSKLFNGNTEDTLRKLGGGTLKIQELENVNVKFNVATGTLHFVTSYTSTSELSGAGVVMADGNGVVLNFGLANCAAYSGTPIVQNGATLILPAGAENGMTVPAGCTLKLVLSEVQQAVGYTMDLAKGSTATFVGVDFTPLPDDGDGDPNTFTPALNTWTANNGIAWETATNWSNGLPGNGDSVAVEINGDTTLTLSGDRTVGTLVVKGSGILTLDGNKLTVTNTLKMNNVNVMATPNTLAAAVVMGTAGTESFTMNVESAESTSTSAMALSNCAFTKSGAGTLTLNPNGIVLNQVVTTLAEGKLELCIGNADPQVENTTFIYVDANKDGVADGELTNYGWVHSTTTTTFVVPEGVTGEALVGSCLTDTGAVVKQGAGTLELGVMKTDANPYTGATTIEAGTLVYNVTNRTANALVMQGAITVKAGAAIKGSANCTLASLILENGATIDATVAPVTATAVRLPTEEGDRVVLKKDASGDVLTYTGETPNMDRFTTATTLENKKLGLGVKVNGDVVTLVLTQVSVPSVDIPDNASDEERAELLKQQAEAEVAAQVVADVLAASTDEAKRTANVTAIENPGAASVIENVGVKLTQNEGEQTYTAKFTYNFGVSAIKVVALDLRNDVEGTELYVVVKAELADAYSFTEGVTVTVTDGENPVAEVTSVTDMDGVEINNNPTGNTRYFRFPMPTKLGTYSYRVRASNTTP